MTSRLQSLRVRLPLVIGFLILVMHAVFLAVAHYQVEHTLVQAGGERARVAADQLASLLAFSAQQRLAEVRGAAGAEPIIRVLQEHTDETRAAALKRLSPLAAAGQPPVEVWDAAGNRVLELAGPLAPGARPHATLPASAPISVGVSAFHALGNTVFYEAVAEATHGSRRLGYVRVRRSFASAAPSDTISRLVGRGAIVLIGNRSGDVWSDLAKAVTAPPVRVTQNGVQSHRTAGGDEHLGAVALIAGTPWAAWVGFPRPILVAPAFTFTSRMLVIGLCFVVAVAVAAHAVSARITTPLHDLTRAAESIAAGHYSRGVAAERQDEIGRLGSAFNVMAERVEESHRDLEQRVQQRLEEVKEVRQELDRFFSCSLDLLCIAGADGYFKRVNPAWESVLGWTREELTTKPYSEFIHPDDLTATQSARADLADGNSVLAFENRYRHKDGTYRWLQWKAVPSLEQGLIYAAARDVTDQKRAEEVLQEHADALASANKELESFSYSVSHDLRTPLRHMTGFAELLEQRSGAALDEQGQRYLKKMKTSAKHMDRLIDDLLAFSRMGRTSLQKRRVELGPLVDEVRREVTADINGREIVWKTDALPAVDADPAMLRLAIVNLLSNAVKYTCTRTPAHIEVSTNGGTPEETVLLVRDNGVGFDMRYAHKLFGVFQRLHRAEEFEGTGIGLANVRRIIQRHGGRVWVESEVDRGTTFYVALPNDGGRTRDV